MAKLEPAIKTNPEPALRLVKTPRTPQSSDEELVAKYPASKTSQRLREALITVLTQQKRLIVLKSVLERSHKKTEEIDYLKDMVKRIDSPRALLYWFDKQFELEVHNIRTRFHDEKFTKDLRKLEVEYKHEKELPRWDDLLYFEKVLAQLKSGELYEEEFTEFIKNIDLFFEFVKTKYKATTLYKKLKAMKEIDHLRRYMEEIKAWKVYLYKVEHDTPDWKFFLSVTDPRTNEYKKWIKLFAERYGDVRFAKNLEEWIKQHHQNREGFIEFLRGIIHLLSSPLYQKEEEKRAIGKLRDILEEQIKLIEESIAYDYLKKFRELVNKRIEEILKEENKEIVDINKIIAEINKYLKSVYICKEEELAEIDQYRTLRDKRHAIVVEQNRLLGWTASLIDGYLKGTIATEQLFAYFERLVPHIRYDNETRSPKKIEIAKKMGALANQNLSVFRLETNIMKKAWVAAQKAKDLIEKILKIIPEPERNTYLQQLRAEGLA